MGETNIGVDLLNDSDFHVEVNSNRLTISLMSVSLLSLQVLFLAEIVQRTKPQEVCASDHMVRWMVLNTVLFSHYAINLNARPISVLFDPVGLLP